MLSNQITVDAAGVDHVVMGGNMRRRMLIVTCAGGSAGFVNIGRPSIGPGGVGQGWLVINNQPPISLTYEMLGDSITGEVHVSAGASNTFTITEYFTN